MLDSRNTQGGPFVDFAVIFLFYTTIAWTRLSRGNKKYKWLTYLRGNNKMLK